MDILGIDVCKQRLDVALLHGERCRQAVFANTEVGFGELLRWPGQHRPTLDAPLHACMEATGNWGLEVAEVLHGAGMTVSIVNPSRVKAYGQSELARNKTDKLDAALIARCCRAHRPIPWTPPAAHLRELRELMRRCDGLKAMRGRKSTGRSRERHLQLLRHRLPITSSGWSSRSRRPWRRCRWSLLLIQYWPATKP